jgi:hypothetical protein
MKIKGPDPIENGGKRWRLSVTAAPGESDIDAIDSAIDELFDALDEHPSQQFRKLAADYERDRNSARPGRSSSRRIFLTLISAPRREPH